MTKTKTALDILLRIASEKNCRIFSWTLSSIIFQIIFLKFLKHPNNTLVKKLRKIHRVIRLEIVQKNWKFLMETTKDYFGNSSKEDFDISTSQNFHSRTPESPNRNISINNWITFNRNPGRNSGGFLIK